MSWSVQNRAWLVCAVVLLVLSTRPRSLTWLKSSAYCLLVRGVGTVGPELAGALERQRPHPWQTQSEHRAGPGLPDAGPRGRQAEVGDRGGAPTPVVRAQRQHCLGRLLADGDPVRLRRAVRDRSQVGRVVRIEDRLAGAQLRLETGQRVVRRGRDRGLRRGAGRGCRRGGVRLVAACDRAPPRRRWRRGRCPCRPRPRQGTCCRSSQHRRPHPGRPGRSHTGPRCSRTRPWWSRQGSSRPVHTGSSAPLLAPKSGAGAAIASAPLPTNPTAATATAVRAILAFMVSPLIDGIASTTRSGFRPARCATRAARGRTRP